MVVVSRCARADLRIGKLSLANAPRPRRLGRGLRFGGGPRPKAPAESEFGVPVQPAACNSLPPRLDPHQVAAVLVERAQMGVTRFPGPVGLAAVVRAVEADGIKGSASQPAKRSSVSFGDISRSNSEGWPVTNARPSSSGLAEATQAC
jgi:hypothetical protein